ncbi:hypothetical protein ACX8Z9_07155 [Arthrobacter halodurans]|uniref:Uncharacterized protein n=1 Tax=Arthrobacter halodurans TaxID=516699 RepID=A0ABV4UPT9_9MICC
MAETREGSSPASSALERLRASQPRESAPANASPDAADASPDAADAPAAPGGGTRARTAVRRPPPPARAPGAGKAGDHTPAAESGGPANQPAGRPSPSAGRIAEPTGRIAARTGLPPQPPRAPLPGRPGYETPRHMAGHQTRVNDDGTTSRKALSDWLDHLEPPDWDALAKTLALAWSRQRSLAAERSAARAERREIRHREARAREARRHQAELERAERERAELQRAELERAELERAELERAARERSDGGPGERRPAHPGPAAGGSSATLAGLTASESADTEADLAGLIENAREAIAAAREHPEGRIHNGPERGLPPRGPVWIEDTEPEPIYVPPYNLPSTEPNPPEVQADLYRRTAQAVAAGVALLLGFLCLGVFGGETAHSTPGSPFHPDFSLLSMDVDSFAVWGIILIGLAVSAVYSWHPSQRSSRRQRSLGYPTAGASLLGALWLLAARNGLAGTALWIAAALTAVLVYCLHQLNRRTARSTTERVLTDAPIGLFLGWMLALLPMSVGVWLTSRSIDVVLPASWWAALSVVAATWAAVSFSMSERGRIIVALGFGWGLFWTMTARLLGPNDSALVAILAGVCAFIVILATENRRYQIGHAERRAARGQRTEF